ncbi:hypothetical protein CDL12_16124 [Handroanthus impetiginosus]|uniref:Transmembrane protein n=1 Tax=Handroanthus impetiginosus TaxID=429701 RepID=A0A2G9H162_9LAMI|nr:hypothetical protein CDL12_16124 [Handroanthus impetiginosus]
MTRIVMIHNLFFIGLLFMYNLNLSIQNPLPIKYDRRLKAMPPPPSPRYRPGPRPYIKPPPRPVHPRPRSPISTPLPPPPPRCSNIPPRECFPVFPSYPPTAH